MTDIQWVASEAWVTARLLTSPRFHHLLEGTLGFSFPGVTIPGLKEFLLSVRPSPKPGMEFINMFWEELFGCRLDFGGVTRFQENEAGTVDNIMRLEADYGNASRSLVTSTVQHTVDENDKAAAEKPVCTGSEDLMSTDSSYTDVSKVRISYNVYKAVYAIAHALHTLLNCDSTGLYKGVCENQKSFTSRQVSLHTANENVEISFHVPICIPHLVCCSVLWSFFTPIFEQLLDHLKAVNFTNQFEEKVHFDTNGEPVPLYEIINWQRDSNGDMR